MQKTLNNQETDTKKTRVLFLGTPQIAADILSGLIDAGYNIVGVITEPDKPVGRGKEMTASPVKKLAQDGGLKVSQPSSHEELLQSVKDFAPDLMVIAAYGRILKKEVLDIPKYRCINVHVSLLPALRGPSPIQYAILEGLKETGVTIMEVTEGMDEGPIISQEKIKIDKKETTSSLFKKAIDVGTRLLIETLPKYLDGSLKSIEQSKEGVSYSKMIRKEDGKIDFSKSAEEEERKLRAYDVWPGSFAFLDSSLPRVGGKRIKFLSATVCQSSDKNKGEIFLNNENNLCVKFENGCWIIETLQLEGEKAISAKDFLNGHKDIIGSILE